MRIPFAEALFISAIVIVSFVGDSSCLAQTATSTNLQPRRITLTAEYEPVRQLLMRIGSQSGLSIIVNGNISGRVSVSLHGVTVDQALTAVLKPLGYSYEHDGSIIVVTEARLRGPRPSASPGPTLAPTVIDVTIISADRAAAILRHLYPHSQITVDRTANAVIAVASAEDIQGMRLILQGIDIKNPTSTTVEAVQVHLANPNDIVAKLRPLYPGDRIAAGPNKSILIAATPQDMAQIKSIVTSIDAPTASPVPTSAAAEAVRIIQAQPKDVARAIAHEFPSVRASVVGPSVILMGAPDDVAKAKSLIALIDQPNTSMRYIQVYRLRFIDAKSVGDLISRSFVNAQVAVDPDLNALTVRATASDQQRIADAITQLDASPGAAVNSSGGPSIQQPGAVSNTIGPGGSGIEIFSLKAAAPGVNGAPSTSATDIATTVTQALQQTAPDLHITVPPNSTQLVLTGSPYSIKLARDLISQLDVAQKLVVLDTEILEVDETVAKNLGLQLSPLITTTYSEITPSAPITGGTPPPLLGLQPLSRTPLSFSATLNLALQTGNARILADPRITTISGRTATIRAGDNISILTTTGGGTGTVATTQLQTFQTGVTLDITPVINAGNFITVSLHPAVNSLSGITNGIPQISTRETQTTVGMQEDETLVIGGLIQDNTSRNTTKIPIFGDIPLLGRLFRSESVNHTRNELIITVTPHILNPGAANVILPGPPLPVMPSPAPLPTLPPGTQLPKSSKLGQMSAIAQPTPTPSSVAPSPSPTAGVSSFVSVATAAPSASPFPDTNVFTYGKIPSNTYAAQNDPVQIFFATFSPTVLKNNDPVQIRAITTINVKALTISYPGFTTQLAQTSSGQWQAAYNFGTASLPIGQTKVVLTLTATGTAGQSSSIQIPVNII